MYYSMGMEWGYQINTRLKYFICKQRYIRSSVLEHIYKSNIVILIGVYI